MNFTSTNPNGILLTLFVLFAFTACSPQQEPPKQGKLELVDTLAHEDLTNATSVAISPDGKFAYAASFSLGAISVLQHDSQTGTLRHQATTRGIHLMGGASVRLDPQGIYGVCAGYQAEAVSLFKRDSETGSLTLLDTVWNRERGADSLYFAIESVFSQDSRFAYVGSDLAVTVFFITPDEKLEVVETILDPSIRGIRSLAVSPDDEHLYVGCMDSNCLLVFERNVETGRIERRQVVADNSFANALEGLLGIACSPDGRHVYANSGRFRGDDAVSVFERQEDGTLSLVQELFEGPDFQNFRGGNEIIVSPDGLLVCALASMSDTLAYFKRDPISGRLTIVDVISVGSDMRPGCAGITFSPNGEHCYVADEASGEIVTYRYY